MSYRRAGWLVLAVVAVLGRASAVRAELLPSMGPADVPHPPSATTPTVPGRLVPAGGLVVDQYVGAGLLFSPRPLGPGEQVATAVGVVEGNSAWVGVLQTQRMSGWRSALCFEPSCAVSATFVDPLTGNPAPVDQVRVGVALSARGTAYLSAETTDGQVHWAMATGDGPLVSVGVDGANFRSFSVYAIAEDGGPIPLPVVQCWPGPATEPFVWGVTEVGFGRNALVTVPEPGSLALAALGVLGAVGLWRRRRRVG